MKHRITGALIAAAAVAAPHATANADAPVHETVQIQIQDTNPCTGDLVDVSLTFSINRHTHRNNTVLTISTSSTTSDGWSGGGSDTVIANQRGVIETVNLRLTNPDDPRFFVVKHVWKYGPDGEPEVIRDTFDCRP